MPEKINSSSPESAKGQYSKPAVRKYSVVLSKKPSVMEKMIGVTSAELEDAIPSPAAVMRQLKRLRPVLPFLFGGLRMIDHTAIQIIAQLLNLVDGGGENMSQTGVHPELQKGMAEIHMNQRQLSRQMQDQLIDTKRIEEQMTHLRDAADRNTAQHAAMVEQLKSLGSLIRFASTGLAGLLVILIVLVSLLFMHRG